MATTVLPDAEDVQRAAIRCCKFGLTTQLSEDVLPQLRKLGLRADDCRDEVRLWRR